MRTLHLEFARITLGEFRKRFLYILIVPGKYKRKCISVMLYHLYLHK